MTVPPEHHGGAGTPLLALHGFTDTWRAWTPVLPALEEHHEVLAPTLPGHYGGSPFPDGVEMTVEAGCDLLEERMDEEGWGVAHIVGSSYGGWLALELAARGRARSVVGVCPAGGWEPRSREGEAVYRYFIQTHHLLKATGRMAHALAARRRLKWISLHDVVAHPERVPPRAALDMIEGAAGCSVVNEGIALARRDGAFGELGAIDCPVRILYGERDRLIRWPGHYLRLLRLLPDAEFLALPDAGHLPMWDDPELVARRILEVTQRVDAAVQT
ncbi:alpha/beta fold hydrolase [Capillimicrobium parvum]|uniref:Lipase 3 n=1 Tax=Capillimicrobium parvum TaxID=2884022 RepID=A0A9E6XU45_9ACTN|nr:alpha/beta hydrolase [Capillimicrobium parvum]UGS34547.1 Lipase 3 [Capillimicrobium parvum]